MTTQSYLKTDWPEVNNQNTKVFMGPKIGQD